MINSEKFNKFEQNKIETLLIERTIYYHSEKKHQKFLLKHPSAHCNHRLYFQWDDLE